MLIAVWEQQCFLDKGELFLGNGPIYPKMIQGLNAISSTLCHQCSRMLRDIPKGTCEIALRGVPPKKKLSLGVYRISQPSTVDRRFGILEGSTVISTCTTEAARILPSLRHWKPGASVRSYCKRVGPVDHGSSSFQTVC